MRPRVFVSHELPGDAVARLAAACDVVVGGGVSGPRFAAEAATFDVVVALLTDRIDEALLDRAPRLRLVANVAVGVDHVDLAACAARGVRVTNTPGVLTESTADLAFGLLLAAARRIAEGDRRIRSGAFPAWTPTAMLGAPVHGTTLGLLGMGRIGQAMARRARGFGMSVFYNNRRRLAPELERALLATWVPLERLFAEVDFLSVHVPLTEETRHLVSRERLATMRAGSVLVNTSRGAVVDEAALAEALASGPLGAAGLDVFEDEPRVHPALLARENAVLTPHVGSADGRTRAAMASLAADNVLAWLRGEPLPSPVGP
jgi:glyoxylate reductase